MTHKTTTIPKRGNGPSTAPPPMGPAIDRRRKKRNVMIDGPTHLVVGVTSRTTACGLHYGPKPALPYTLAKHRHTIDRARIDGALPPVDWCPACLAHFGWISTTPTESDGT